MHGKQLSKKTETAEESSKQSKTALPMQKVSYKIQKKRDKIFKITEKQTNKRKW